MAPSESHSAAEQSPAEGNVGPDPDNDVMRLWHKHIWGEWERA
jgi:hypothetical protein